MVLICQRSPSVTECSRTFAMTYLTKFLRKRFFLFCVSVSSSRSGGFWSVAIAYPLWPLRRKSDADERVHETSFCRHGRAGDFHPGCRKMSENKRHGRISNGFTTPVVNDVGNGMCVHRLSWKSENSLCMSLATPVAESLAELQVFVGGLVPDITNRVMWQLLGGPELWNRLYVFLFWLCELFFCCSDWKSKTWIGLRLLEDWWLSSR